MNTLNTAYEKNSTGIVRNPSVEENGVTLYDNGSAYSFLISGVSYMIEKDTYNNLSEDKRNELLSSIKESQESHTITNDTKAKLLNILN